MSIATRKVSYFLISVVVLMLLLSPFSSTIQRGEQTGSQSNTETTAVYSDQVTFISKSTGLDTPEKEGGNTEYELADMNNDGHLDIISVGDHGSPYVNSNQHGIMVWLGDGQGTWSVHQVGEFGYGGIEAGDLNLDGNLDVVWGVHHNYGAVGFGDTLLGAALGDGTGLNWIPWATGLGTGGEDWGMFETGLADFDCNGLLDIISQSFGCCNGYHEYENHGDGTWTQVWSLPGGNNNNNLETADFNADGYPDFAGNRETTHVFFGDGTFNFTMTQNGLPTENWNGLDCGDMNNDGYDDIVVGSGSSGVGCYFYDTQNNDWDTASNGLPNSGAYNPQFGDCNGDGYLDIIGYVGPVGYLYLGDGTGNWVADATFSMLSPGYFSAFVVDGDFDHDGREDVVIQAEQGSWPSYQNQLKAFSPWLEPTQLTALVQTPGGGETFRSGSIRNIRWLSAIPPAKGQSTVDIQLSLNGVAGPWETIASDRPNNGCYQWVVDADGSDSCRMKITVTTSSSTVSAVSSSDFTILGFNVDAHGPYQGTVGEILQFTGSAEGGTPPYTYHWQFGDGSTSEQQNPTHTYTTMGNFTVILTVTDNDGVTARDTTWALIPGENNPPGTPIIDGPAKGKIGLSYLYTFSTIDPDGDTVFYYIDWGDNTSNGWIGPYPSGVVGTQMHTWLNKGTYTIRCKAKDVYDAESDWGVLQVKMPMSFTFPTQSFLERILERFQFMFPILRHMLDFN